MSRDPSKRGGVQRSPAQYLRRSLLTGAAIVLPVLLTVVVLFVVIDLLSVLLNPIVIPIQELLGANSPLVAQLIAASALLVTILLVGSFTESRVGGERLKRGLDSAITRIPGIGSIYSPLDRISTMLLEGDTQNFQNVVLVEFPKEGSYSIAFQTSHPPEMIEETTGSDGMMTVFMPMGPNPFMGGFVLHLSEDEVYEVDLSVEEGISSVVSFGVAMEMDEHPSGVPVDLSDLKRT